MNWLRNDYVAITLIVLIAFGAAIGGAYIPPLKAQAAPAQSDTECVLWADIKPWAITRCESWEDNTVCYLATSGFLQCFKAD